MSAFLLWFSIFSFTIFLLSIFPVILRRQSRNKPKLDSLYLGLMLCYGIWLVLFSFLYFSDVFVRPVGFVLRTGFGIIRSLVTASVLILYPFFLKELTGRIFMGRKQLLVFLSPAIYAILLVPIFTRASVLMASVVTILYNLYFSGLSAAALILLHGRHPGKKNLVFFIRLMLIYNASGLLIVLLPAAPSEDAGLVISVLPRAVFCLCWGIIELAFFINREYRKELEGELPVPSVFADDFGITPREKDIIASIADGLSNREISDKLFISERTVETHIYSIYRKCKVKNKVELLNQISNYR